MKIRVLFICGCVTLISAHAVDFGDAAAKRELQSPSVGPFFVHATLAKDLLMSTRDHRLAMGVTQHRPQPDRPMATYSRKSPYARAIEKAARRGVVELAVEAYTDVLIQCQKAQSVVLTTPFLRSESQQAHCFRF